MFRSVDAWSATDGVSVKVSILGRVGIGVEVGSHRYFVDSEMTALPKLMQVFVDEVFLVTGDDKTRPGSEEAVGVCRLAIAGLAALGWDVQIVPEERKADYQ